ncbi:HalOD1 output domain-containing protein [Natrinema marinum]|uniref:HalOD1 output domain-containing protein n=1 Tax=Natrinema marinum TaxID=2961598 RepID=UPI0020C8E9E8|nr:HalOD1 output domain-containing protein [Natrinema marinum]
MVSEQGSRRFVADGGSTFVTEFDCDESAVRAVSRSLAAVKGVSEIELEPLYNRVEVDALDRMIRHANGRDGSVLVEFTIEGCTVHVTDERVIQICFDEDGSAMTDDDC